MSGWRSIRQLIQHEVDQAIEEGKDPTAVHELRQEASRVDDDRALESLHARLLELPVSPQFAFLEPDDLPSIRAHRIPADPTASLRRELDDQQLLERLYGAWLGRSIGCALGKPVEYFMDVRNGLTSWERQKAYLTAISPDEWPLRDYIPEHSPAESLAGRSACPWSTRDHIAFMESDDDIRYTVLAQQMLAEEGANFTSESVARVWLRSLPYDLVFTAETQAYRNIVLDVNQLRSKQYEDSTQAIDWRWVSHHLNPYREWIGAQIRVDSYAYAAPGRPELAAEFAYRDARISHAKNGVYGAMFCASMIAAAFEAETVEGIIEAGLGQIPSTSRLYAAMRRTLEICSEHGNDFEGFESVIRALHDEFSAYDPVHTINNAAACVAALVLGAGDFHRSVTFSVMCGWDTDCNGATVGSIVGAMLGADGIPEHWSGRLNDTLLSMVPGYHPIAISECARRSLEIARAVEASTTAALQ